MGQEVRYILRGSQVFHLKKYYLEARKKKFCT